MSESSSVKRVSRERWQEAQRWEAGVWDRWELKSGVRKPLWKLVRPIVESVRPSAGHQDWNDWWAAAFDDYSFLPAQIGSVVELGCGPYTNVRLVLRARTAKRVVCSDPLVRRYVRYRGTWLRETFRSGAVELDDAAIEDTSLPHGSFDLVVVINVLDHVRDADLCLRKAVDLLAPGGLLILGQDLSDADDLARIPDDVGHPIRLHEEDVRPHLQQLDPVVDRVLEREQGRNPLAHYATLIYVGRRPASSE